MSDHLGDEQIIRRLAEGERRSGFEDDPLYVKPCNSTLHNPPQFMVIPRGKIYRHVCPSCGNEQILRPPMTMMWSTECSGN